MASESHAPARPGPRNLITDVAGLSVGSAHDARVRTGVTVILADGLVVAGCDVSGGGPGTRETDALRPENLVGRLDAITLSGGSVYGLGAADAVTAALGAQGRGYRLRPVEGIPLSPLVGGAILYDLANGGDKAWGEAPPYATLAREALTAAGDSFALGTHGAGFGAMAGTLKGASPSAPWRRSTASARWSGPTAARSGPRRSRSATSSAAPTPASSTRAPTPGPLPSATHRAWTTPPSPWSPPTPI
jgi:L-aminopeptidase/D-esterase-like protein